MIMIPFPEKGDAVMGGGTVIRDSASGEPVYDEERKVWQLSYKGASGSVFYDIEARWRYDKTAWEEV